MKSINLTTTLILAISSAIASGQSYLYKPDIHDNRIVFTSEGDLWLGNLTTGHTSRLTSDPGLESNAKFSPDGKSIAFTGQYNGKVEIYVMPSTGGIPKRITFDPTSPMVLGWTPDGKDVIYRSYRYSPFAPKLFEVPASGGPVTTIKVPVGYYGSLNQDGIHLAYVPICNEWMNWFRYSAGEADEVWMANLKTGNFKRMTDTPYVDTTPVWVGKVIYFISERSGVRNLWQLNPANNAVKQITFSTSEPVQFPSTDGKRVIYQLGDGLGVYNPETGKADVLNLKLNSDRIHAVTTDQPIARNLESSAIGPTGKRIAVISSGQLVTIPAKSGPMHAIEVDSSQRARNASWSPDGKSIAFIGDKTGEEQLYVANAEGTSAPRQVTTALGGENFRPVWSPDGKLIVIGNRVQQVMLVNVATGAITTVDQADRGGSYDVANQDYQFSPDGKWLAYSKVGEGWNTSVWVYNIADGKTTLVTDPTMASSSPTFSPDGKFLFVDQTRITNVIGSAYSSTLAWNNPQTITAIALLPETPSPFAEKDQEEGTAESSAKKSDDKKKGPSIDLDGIMSRTFNVPIDAGNYSQAVAIDGKIILANSTSPGLTDPGEIELQSYDLATKSLDTLASGLEALGNGDDPWFFQISQDGKTALIKSGGTLKLVALDGGSAKPVPTQGLYVSINPIEQWKETFEEAWRAARDFYIDPNMGGVDWEAVRKKYEAQLPKVGDTSDLSILLGDMLSELSTGHCYVNQPNPYGKAPENMGYLGAIINYNDKLGAYQIDHVMQSGLWSLENSSPLASPGLNIKDGDCILAVNGKQLSDQIDFQSALLGTAGRVTSLTIAPSSDLKATRNLNVVPMSNQRQLIYLDWVQGRKEYVQKASHGQIAYVHVSDMETAGANDFARMYFANTDKPGIIIDVRYNGGGLISYDLLNFLATKPVGFFKPRYGLSWRRESWAPMGHVVGIANEFDFSDGELFSEYFKRLKIGPLVGHRTGGGEIGSGNGYALVNGGSIYVPNYGAWSGDKWLIEGRGVQPDVPVDQDPTLVMEGKDPQLDAAIAIIMKELAAHPFSMPTPPKFPNHTGFSGSEKGVSNH